jgi:tRNA nucleotidyltransferase (CCA-adding enzyme)
MARREEYATPAALPRVSPAPIDEDLLRRDFTANSMAVGLTGPCTDRVLDPSGGARDLGSGRLRLHHGKSLVDDPTRAFRAARYAARLSLLMAPGWQAAMTAATRRGAFRRLSPARIRRELSMIWQETDPAAALARGTRWGLLRRIDPGLHWSRETKASIRNAASLPAIDEAARSRLMFALLLRAAAPSGRQRLCGRIGLGGMARRRLLEAARAPEEAEALVLAWRRSGEDPRELDSVSRRDPLWLAAALAAGSPSTRSGLSQMTQRWTAARPRLDGKDVMALGVPRGPAVGRALHAIRLARASGRIRTRRQEADLVRALAPGGRKSP